MDSTPASKGDINGLKNDISETRVELKNDIIEVKTELKNDIVEVKTELKTDIQGLNTQLILVKWMLGIIIAVEILPLLKQLF